MEEREQRLQTIRQILGQSSVVSQARLVELLAGEGFAVTQSSVSRDLRDLPVRKVDGAYRLVPVAEQRNGTNLDDILARNLERVEQAGANLLIITDAWRTGQATARPRKRSERFFASLRMTRSVYRTW